MKPEVDQILHLSAQQLMGGLAPLLPTGYAQGTAALTSFMLILSAEEYDHAADIRAAENADIRRLFRELAPRLSDRALKAKLEAAAESRDESLKISALNAANTDLRRLLIALHEIVESDAGANARVWAVLKDMASRRVLTLPGA